MLWVGVRAKLKVTHDFVSGKQDSSALQVPSLIAEALCECVNTAEVSIAATLCFVFTENISVPVTEKRERACALCALCALSGIQAILFCVAGDACG